MKRIRDILHHIKNRNEAINESCDYYIAKIDTALFEIERIFHLEDTFIDQSEAALWRDFNSQLFEETASIKKYKRAKNYGLLFSRRNNFCNERAGLEERVSRHNDRIARKEIDKAYFLMGDVEGNQLDDQQMTCIIKEAYNQLVIAGAGTGKTTTVVGKVKYLLKANKYKPEEILVLSFTNASASEMNQRIQKETGHPIAATTFHKLGIDIITEVDGMKPKISKLNLRKFLKENLLKNMKTKSYLELLNSYLIARHYQGRSEFDFEKESEYREYLKINPPTSLQREILKSYGEMEIANFLTQHNVEYIYEAPYKVDTRTSEFGQYCPDFFLPEYDIYIEYFGVDRNCKVPSYFKDSDTKTASELYYESMKWKHKVHFENNTTMIECYAYELFEGILIEKLKENLKAQSVTLNQMSPESLWETISSVDNSLLDGIIDLFGTAINLIKSNRYTIPMVKEINRTFNSSGQQTSLLNAFKSTSNEYRENEILLNLLEPISNNYNALLQTNNEIDFNDMINLATMYVEQGKYNNPYKYVIVDEYQDISKSRFALLRELRKTNDYDLFCVGDDWQSIYRFAGSDINYIINFSDYWGPTEVSRIEKTYRFTEKLIEISGNFIMKNPNQIKKSMKGKTNDLGFVLGEIAGYTEKYAIQFMIEKLNDLPKRSKVFFIGRYSFDINLLSDSGQLRYQYNNITKMIEIIYPKRRDLDMNFITAHKSKGLQADYIFIINNRNSRMGFPSKIQDSELLNLLLDNHEQFPHAEERRLFYVALTRAKKKAYIITSNGRESEFTLELKKEYAEELKKERFECPRCGGRIIKKTGPYGEFWGCSNYHSKGCKYSRNVISKK